MGFRCGICGNDQEAGTKATPINVEIRRVEYHNLDPHGMIAETSYGKEIKKQVLACPECANIYRSREAAVAKGTTVRIVKMTPKKKEQKPKGKWEKRWS